MAAPLVMLLLIAAISQSACASDVRSTLEEALFEDLGDRLSPSQRTDLAATLGFQLADGGVTWLDPICRLPMDAPRVWFDDLDRDGAPEIAVQAGNTCSAGYTGALLWLFAPADGNYRLILQTIAYGYQPRPQRTANYPDLSLGGPGFCHPVWRWNGTQYEFHHLEDETPGACKQKHTLMHQELK